MLALLKHVMERYGTSVLWRSKNGEEALRGFLQPVTTRSWQKLRRQATVVGDAPTGMYVFYGPPSMVPMAGDMLTVQGREYDIRRSEMIYGAGEPAYCWALCARRGEA